MKILFLSRWFPYPTNNGSKLRIYNLLRGLAEKHEITLLTFADQSGVDSTILELSSICKEIRVVDWQQFDPNSWRARIGLLSMTPRSAVDTYSQEMQRQIKHLLSAERFDLIIASQWSMAGYSKYFCDVPAIFEEVEVGLHYQYYAQAKSIKQRLRHGLSWTKHERYIAKLLKNFFASTVVSEQEEQLLSRISPDYKNIEIIPNCIQLDDYQATNVAVRPNTLVFTGSFHYHANYEAMVWFLEYVFPLVLAQSPEVELTITGDHLGLPLPDVRNVNLVGFIDDIQSLVASSWMSVVPLQVGGGTRLKILEAMALHTPVVSTSKGAEGLDCNSGDNLLIADEPKAYAEAVIRLLKSPDLRNRLSDNAYKYVSEYYNWSVVMPRFMNLVETASKSGFARQWVS